MRRKNEMTHSAICPDQVTLVRRNISRRDNLLRHGRAMLAGQERTMTGWQLSDTRCTDETVLC
jgi:hypothetical protein